MYFRNRSIDEILNICRTAIENSLSSPDIQTAVARFGYDEPTLQHGKDLLEDATSRHQRQVKEYNEQYAATREYEEAFQAAHDQYMQFVQMSRVVFKNNMDSYQQLRLFGERKRNFPEWITQVRQYYTEALDTPAIQTELAKWGITMERLQGGQQLMEKTVDAQNRQQKESGEAQQATQERDVSIDALYSWTDDYLTIAEIALKDKPQRLEQLGIVVKS
ncbi:MAG: hypothetical protein GF372_14945 [Candidatus Marinimicrobia bacterium]|nr:hypothetical protein [Candidatus Neomarinimicrobiota bacterium]